MTRSDASGSTVLAARRLNTAAIPAGRMVGTTTIGHHIILLPKLALSCEVKISPVVTIAPAAARPASVRSNRPVRTSCSARPPPLPVAAAGGEQRSSAGSSLSLRPGRNSCTFCLIPVGMTARAFSSPWTMRTGGLHLFEGGVWRDRREVRVGVYVEDGRPVSRERLAPGLGDLVRAR